MSQSKKNVKVKKDLVNIAVENIPKKRVVVKSKVTKKNETKNTPKKKELTGTKVKKKLVVKKLKASENKQFIALKAVLSKIPTEKENEARLLAHQMFFILEELDKLQSDIKKNGTVEMFEQGQQKFKRERPEVKNYNSLMGTFDKCLTKMINLSKSNVQVQQTDIFDEFVSARYEQE